MDKVQGLRKHHTVNFAELHPHIQVRGRCMWGSDSYHRRCCKALRGCRPLNVVYLIPESSNLRDILYSSVLEMTSFPEFGEATTATEVADAFSDQIKGKNGVHHLSPKQILNEVC